MIEATIYNDPACPWAYSAIPALRVLEWRYRDQLRWRLVLIGLTEEAEQYIVRGYTPLRNALTQQRFRRYGMPFSPNPKPRVSGTARACRAVAAARLDDPGSEWLVFRALQLANFTTQLLLDDDEQLADALDAVPGIDGRALVARLDDSDVNDAYEHDRVESRTALGSPAELQDKTATTDGPVRFTAPSVVFQRDGLQLTGGGFQPVEAYDVLLVNLDPTLAREAPPDTPRPLLDWFDGGLTTQEVAALMTRGNDAPDRPAAEISLLELAAAGEATRQALGDDATWHAT